MITFIVARVREARPMELGAAAYFGPFSVEREAMEFAADMEDAEVASTCVVLPVHEPVVVSG